ncbi:MAG: redoxin domain-containing protein [Actinomycetes bacterium]
MSWDWATPAGLHAHGAELPVEGRLASFDGATGWLNSEPLTPPGLLGKVVVVDFWTYTCVNWLRQLPYVRAWADRYADHGLVVVGVHTPEFDFERDVDNIRAAVGLRDIGYPVAIDSRYGVWRAFDNHYWPALYFADAQGRIRHHHYGEGEYEQSEMVIQQLLVEAGSSPGRERVSVQPRGLEVAADWATLMTPETYTGYDRADGFASPEGLRPSKPQPYTAPAQLRLNEWALAGGWTIDGQPANLNTAGGRVVCRFHARDVNLVMGPAMRGTPLRYRLLVDGQPPGEAHGDDVDEAGNGTLAEQRLHQLVRQHDRILDRTVEITFLDPEAQVFCFTFG